MGEDPALQLGTPCLIWSIAGEMGARASAVNEDGDAAGAALCARQATATECFGQSHRLISAPRLFESARRYCKEQATLPPRHASCWCWWAPARRWRLWFSADQLSASVLRPRRVPPLQCSSRTPLRLFALLPFPCIHPGACTGLIPWQGEPEGGSCFRRTLHARLPTMLRDEAATNMESHAQADPGPFLGLCTGGATRVPWSRMGLPFERLPP